MATIAERYSVAVHAKSLVVDERTTMSDSDVLGAMGIADRRLTEGFVRTGRDGQGYPVKPAPLAVSLARMFAGDNAATHDIVRQLSEMAFDQSWALKVKISRVQADDMAKSCLAWHRNGTCQACGGHGKMKIPGTPALDENSNCKACYDPILRASTGKIPFDRSFRHEWRELARWLDEQMTREVGRAGPMAMAAIAPKLEL
jgi:hypothetical protein